MDFLHADVSVGLGVDGTAASEGTTLIGSLAPGMLADVVLWRLDELGTDATMIRSPRWRSLPRHARSWCWSAVGRW
jgi:hypothetical protein